MNQFWRELAFKKDTYAAFQSQEQFLAKQLFAFAGQLIKKLEGSSRKELTTLKAAYALPVTKRSDYRQKLQALERALLPYPLERAYFQELTGYTETLEATLQQAMRSKPTKAQLKASNLEAANEVSSKEIHAINEKLEKLHRALEQDQKKLDSLQSTKTQLDKQR